MTDPIDRDIKPEKPPFLLAAADDARGLACHAVAAPGAHAFFSDGEDARSSSDHPLAVTGKQP